MRGPLLFRFFVLLAVLLASRGASHAAPSQAPPRPQPYIVREGWGLFAYSSDGWFESPGGAFRARTWKL